MRHADLHPRVPKSKFYVVRSRAEQHEHNSKISAAGVRASNFKRTTNKRLKVIRETKDSGHRLSMAEVNRAEAFISNSGKLNCKRGKTSGFVTVMQCNKCGQAAMHTGVLSPCSPYNAKSVTKLSYIRALLKAKRPTIAKQIPGPTTVERHDALIAIFDTAIGKAAGGQGSAHFRNFQAQLHLNTDGNRYENVKRQRRIVPVKRRLSAKIIASAGIARPSSSGASIASKSMKGLRKPPLRVSRCGSRRF
jgi:hypothetical protein